MAACATSSSSASGWSARRSPSARGCSTSRRISSASSRCSSRSSAPVRLEGVLRRRADAVRRPRRATRRRLASPPVARRQLELAPTLRRDGLRGGLLYHDGVEDDARYTLAVARTARAAGGVAVTRVRATGSGPTARRARSGASRPRTCDRRVDRDPDPGRRRRDRRLGRRARPPVRAAARPGSCRAAAPTWSSRGNGSRATGLTIRVPGKVVFLVPWPDHWLIGTTDAPYEGPPDRPRPAAGGRRAPRHRQRDDGRRPDAGRRGRDVRRAAPADRAVRRVDRQGVARAPGHGRGQRPRPDRRRQVHDVPGDGPRRDRCRPRAARRQGAPERHGRPSPGRRRRRRRPGSDRRRARAIPAVGESARDRGRLVARHGTEAPDVVALGAELGLLRPLVAGGRSSRPRSRGPPATSWPSRSTTSWRAGRAWPRSCPTAARRSPRASPRSSARSSAGTPRARARGRDLPRSARREFSVRLRGPPGSPRRRGVDRRGTDARAAALSARRIGGTNQASRRPTCSARSSTALHVPASRSRSGRSSSRSRARDRGRRGWLAAARRHRGGQRVVARGRLAVGLP